MSVRQLKRLVSEAVLGVGHDAQEEVDDARHLDPENYELPSHDAPPVDEKRRQRLGSIFSDIYKEKNGVRPRHVDFNSMSVEDLEAKIAALEAEPDCDDGYSNYGEDDSPSDMMFAHEDEREAANHKAHGAASELAASQVPEEGEEFLKHRGMGRSALEEAVRKTVAAVLRERGIARVRSS